MARILCGNCGDYHDSVAAVRSCHARPRTDTGASTRTPDPHDDDRDIADRATADRAPAQRRAPAPAGARQDRPIEELAGPDELGRCLALPVGAELPAPWRDAVEIAVPSSTAAIADFVAEAEPHWRARRRIVFRFDTEADPALAAGPAEAPQPVLSEAPWTLPATFEWPEERAHLLAWSNTVDGREVGSPRWRWAEAALEAGASAGGPADVLGPGGAPLWCDGGAPTRIELAYPVVHRLALERSSLQAIEHAPCHAELAPDQLAAVTHHGGAARIIAPAGSGKTRVLTERARHLLLDWKVPPGAVTLLAFNKRAADEMVERTRDLPRLAVRTLNALGYALLDGRPPFAPRGERYQVIDEREVRRILDGLLELGRRRLNTDPVAPWIDALSAVRLGLREPAEVEREFGGDVDGLSEVFPRYQSILRDRRLLDFDQQIVGAIEVLLSEPAARETARRSCRLLLVDEFQDLTPAHLLLVRLLSGPDGACFAVGDDDQTIYGYTGATPAWLIGYSTLFPGAGDHPLEVNYRCPTPVVTAAARLVGHNLRRVPKEIRPAPDRQDPSDALRIVDGDDAVSATVDAVLASIADGQPAPSIAVLTRVNASLAPVQVALIHAGVAVRPAVDERWLERTGVRAALAWLRLASRPGRLGARDIGEAARRPSRGLSARVVEWMGEQGDADGLRRLAGRLSERDGGKIEAFVDDLATAARLAERADAAAVLRFVRDQVGLDDAMDALDGFQRAVKGSAQRDDLDALVALAALHADAATFPDWLRDRLGHPGEAEGVMLSTVHAVKGREWPHVVVHEAAAGLFPHRLADDVEEERRVFHVGITRGSARVTVVAGADPSPFVAELTTDPPERAREMPDQHAPFDLAGRPAATPERAESRHRGAEAAAPVHAGRAARKGAGASAPPAPEEIDAGLREALRSWRAERCRVDGVPAYVVFNDRTLDELAAYGPTDLHSLGRITGIGPAKLERYGDDILAVIDSAG